MALDPNIILQARGIQLDSPLDTYARVAQVQAARNQNRIADLAFADKARASAADASLAQLLAGGSSGADVVKGLAGQGYGSQALAYQKTNQESLKSQADIAKTQADTVAKQQEQAQHQFEIAGQLAGSWATNPGISKPMIMAGINAAANSGVLTPQVAQAQLAELEKVGDDPKSLNGWAANKQQQVISAKDQMTNALTQQRNAETMRANKAGEALTASGQAITMRGQNMVDSRSRDATAVASEAKKNKGLPQSALKMQQGELDAIATASAIQSDLGAIEKQIKDNKLDFGLVSNATNSALNAVGMSNESSRNFASFKSTLEKLRNDSLRLNAGVQTDGDAQRAWNELFNNINDKGVVQQRLAEIRNINARAVNLRKLNVDQIRTNFNQDPLDTSRYESQPSALGGGSKSSASSASSTVTIPAGAAAMLKGNPSLRNDFDKKYGAGAAASILGK